MTVQLTASKIDIQPSLEDAHKIISASIHSPNPPNLVPLCASISAEFLNPHIVYLKIRKQ